MKRILILACAFAAVLAAQTPPGDGEGPRGRRGRGMEALQTALGLDETQIQQLQDARRAGAEAMRPIMQQIREKSQEMKAMIDGGAADPAAVGALVLEIHGLRQQIKDNKDATHDQLVNLVNGWGAGEALDELNDAAGLMRAVGEARALGLLDRPEGGERGEGFRGAGRGKGNFGSRGGGFGRF